MALVGLGLPEIFADGAAMGRPAFFIRASAILFLGIRTATVFKPPVVISGTIFDFLRISVIGPGQNFLIILWAFGGI